MTDLTAITTPFGLLDVNTRHMLMAHDGPFEMWTSGSGWTANDRPRWGGDFVYRVKPLPPQPREGWVIDVFETARQAKQAYPGSTPFLVREVLP